MPLAHFQTDFWTRRFCQPLIASRRVTIALNVRLQRRVSTLERTRARETYTGGSPRSLTPVCTVQLVEIQSKECEGPLAPSNQGILCLIRVEV
jgi:hypothetical protein